jgi:hypothetical protein
MNNIVIILGAVTACIWVLEEQLLLPIYSIQLHKAHPDIVALLSSHALEYETTRVSDKKARVQTTHRAKILRHLVTQTSY